MGRPVGERGAAPGALASARAPASAAGIMGRGGTAGRGVDTVLPGRLLDEMMRELGVVTPGMGGRGPGATAGSWASGGALSATAAVGSGSPLTGMSAATGTGSTWTGASGRTAAMTGATGATTSATGAGDDSAATADSEATTA